MPETNQVMQVITDIQHVDDPSDNQQPDDGQIENWVMAILHYLQETRVLAQAGLQQWDTLELTVRITSTSEIQQLNKSYRQKDKPTNILSFPFESPPEVSLPLLGDLVICAAVVNKEALEQGKIWQAHWLHMLVHGILHLLDYDHQDDAEALQMENLEAAIMQAMGYADPYAI